MIALNCEQRSPEWYAARLGIPTSSNFDQIITTKGEPSKSRIKYRNKLAGEKVAGKAEESYQNAAMLHGIEMEAEARSLYEMVKDTQVDPVGLCFFDEAKAFAASPDGLVGADGLIEIKCPMIHTHVAYLLSGELPTDYFQQAQGQMFVTGRKWVDFVSYYPGLKPLILRVKRDPAFIKKLHIYLKGFCRELKEVMEKIS